MLQHSIKIFIGGGTEITSKEGTTQGDPVSVVVYGIGVTLLINMLLIDILSNEYSANVNVMAYSVQFAAAGILQDLTRWWIVLIEIGPTFGYYPEPTEIWLVVK